ncbi:DUF3618 domain-containing protein [Actinomadura sp. GC306]|uniref:DUF3618 domain-containing protein n=1 Tax=Actinomadura sp. GC306 TaxID=2530367 RepID=UPI0010457EBF|nr:DUF3618 domain-containing protein [Actinomadura sp. GC306]TDC65472.1 DUF3618 domain-containing protein [Actinomadura sp. GC306]
MTTQGKHGAEAGTEELRQEVDRARNDLGDTVEQLAAKADVKAVARQKADEAKSRMRDTAAQAQERAKEATARVKEAGGSDSAKRGGMLIAGAGAVALTAVLVRRRRASRARVGSRVKRGAASGLGSAAKAGARAKTAGKAGMPGKAKPGRGRKAPVRVVFRSAQKQPVKVKRTRRPW